jgi:hypothetical protein
MVRVPEAVAPLSEMPSPSLSPVSSTLSLVEFAWVAGRVDLAEVPPADQAGNKNHDEDQHHGGVRDPLQRPRLSTKPLDLASLVSGIPRIDWPVHRWPIVGVDLRLGQQRIELRHDVPHVLRR